MDDFLKKMDTDIPIGMLFLTVLICLQDTTAISMWRFVLLFKPLNTFTNTSTRAMTGQLWRFLIRIGMRSKNIWIPDISLLLNPVGAFLNSICIKNHLL